MPWLVAGFLAMVWLVPFDSVQFPFGLPIDAKLDRIALGGLALVWFLAAVSGRSLNRSSCPEVLHFAILIFIGCAVVSVVLNVDVLHQLGEIELAGKKLALLLFNVAFFMIVATVLRPSEVRSFILLLLGLATITAIGSVWEYRTGFNAFFAWTDLLLPSQIGVLPAPEGAIWEPPVVTGPTTVGLAIVTILAMALPFAVVELARGRTRARKILFSVIVGLIVAGMMSTVKKSAGVVPVAALAALLVYRPRAMARLLPVGIVLVLSVQLLAPGALVTVKGQLLGNKDFSTATTEDRKADYPAVTPDIKKYPLTGRGWGTYDHHKYRVLDNQYLLLFIETGAFGLLAFGFMICAAFTLGHRLQRGDDPRRAPPALGVIGSIAAFVVANALFDAMAFPQVPYMFFFVLGLLVVISRAPAEHPARTTLRRSDPTHDAPPVLVPIGTRR